MNKMIDKIRTLKAWLIHYALGDIMDVIYYTRVDIRRWLKHLREDLKEVLKWR